MERTRILEGRLQKKSFARYKYYHLSNAHRIEKSIFIATAGEDRTGMIAGLYRELSQGWTRDQAFKTEMCPNGFEAGNPRKPPNVVNSIRASLTPIYLKMSRLIETRALTMDHLDDRVCGQDPLPQISHIPTCGSAPQSK